MQLRTSSVKKLVARDESETLEFKGSLSLDVKRLLLGDGVTGGARGLEDEGVLRSIVAMLNSKGGEVVVGVLEQVDFARSGRRASGSRCLRIEDKLILGLDMEYDKKGWDGYQRRLTELDRESHRSRRLGSGACRDCRN